MKLFFFLSVFIFLFYGCSKNTSITNSEEDKEKGGISITIDKKNAPSNVVKLTATLTRNGYDSIEGELNLLTETSADIYLENIFVGNGIY